MQSVADPWLVTSVMQPAAAAGGKTGHGPERDKDPRVRLGMETGPTAAAFVSAAAGMWARTGIAVKRG